MSAPPPATPTPLPLRNCYWVLPGELLAGEHPAGTTRDATRERLQRLLTAGIECFVDLTHPAELERYDTELPFNVEYLRKPIKDHDLPAEREHMVEILDCVHDALRSRRRVYVHCRAGIGRTGMVIGCLLVERGLSGEAALDEVNRLWQQCERAKSWAWVPETDEQTDYVRLWTPCSSMSRTVSGGVFAPGAAGGTRAAAVTKAASAAWADAPSTAAGSTSEVDPLFAEATLSAARGLRERFLGALLGLAVGDALAAGTQYRRAGTFTPVGDMLGGGPFDLPRGGWSDDTAMALCLAESLLECNGFDARDQVERYRLWQQQGYLSATGQCVGITASTARALAVAQWRRQAFSGSHDPGQLDPEPLSRVAPAVMFFFASAGEAFQQASESARTTCQAPAVLEACRSLARALHGALSGRSNAAILADLPGLSGVLARPSAPLHTGTSARASTTAPEALAAAIWAFSTTDNFRDAVLRAANVGGDSDVVAAACGQLAGAFYTAGAIPAHWRKSLIHKDMIEGYADKLLARAVLGLGG